MRVSKLTAILHIVSSTVGYEGSMINGIQSLEQWNSYFQPTTSSTALINATYWLGAIISYPFTQFIGDRWGRKRVIYVGAVISVIATVLQAAAQNVPMFVVSRILFGFSAILSGNSASVLVAESVHPRDRNVLTASYNSNYYIGAILAAWTTFGTGAIASSWSWRIPSLLQGVCAAINVMFLPFVPESPRWLVAKGRVDEAAHVLADAHANGDLDDPLVGAELLEIKGNIRLLKNDNPWRDIYSSSSNRKRLFILIFLGFSLNWSGNGLVSYYLSKVLAAVGITSQDEQTLINGILSITSWLTCIVASWSAGRIGRRTQFLSSSLVMLASFTAVTISNSVVAREPENKHAAVSVIFFIFLFMSGYNWAFNPLAYSYPPEILPYNLRLIGQSTILFACTIAGFFNTYVNPIGLANIGWRYYIVYIAWLATEVVVIYFTFPETLGYSLEEISPLLEDDGFITKLRKKHIVEKNKVVVRGPA
ncbi:unnamed protein product [Clonostachys solani]|uniref:Major facilitator superfamily (MFS) profile domain-containing protein n=1 Tax=Clonostachys solani TaxID=160281 RepID=A0A9N9ZAX3_9HYPO|nr:unnamed protein product [Clonostachys solani]